MAFDNIPPLLGEALTAREYSTLTPVQSAVIVPEAAGRDLVVSAQTGSGKTVAFGLAMAPQILDGGLVSLAGLPAALIIAPTRELALQVARELSWLYAGAQVRIATCVGGMDASKERRNLKNGAQIVVGTPGRLRDHLERGALDLSELKVAILDEADEMLDMGFREELEELLNASPKERRTLMFSATMPKQIVALAKRYQNDALRISTVGEDRGHGDIAYQAVTVAPPDIENAVVNLLRLHEAETAILFCATRESVRHLHAKLNNRGFNAVALSGEHSQQERNAALQSLRNKRARICVATDVAARGIDLPTVTLVIHVEIPRDAEALQHRSGRTGRAGKKGTAVLVVPYQRRKRVESMLRGAKINAEWMKVPTAEEIKAKDHERLLEKLLAPTDIDDGDRVLGATLLETMSPEDIAAKLVAMHRAEMPVAEELLDDGQRAERAQESHRDGFDDAVWFRINVGRKNNADPKWLLPLICRRGGVTKNDVGAIRIAANESFVGIAANSAKAFAKAAQKPGRDEDADVEIVPSDGPPRDMARENKKRGKSGYQGRGGGGKGGEYRGGKGGGYRGKKEGASGEGGNKARPTLGANFGGDKPQGDFKKDGKRPFRKKEGVPSKHGVKHKAKGNRPR
ncbi:DEAD/DEAH box helicase [Sphingorhabdus arenilitoris]|uniref:DEAD/DEAH box helicase n=1 Tax=Sphingorhabdus arenilitoris TaxID=1490041 RepID=A0ABV8RE17_9SPHN